MRRRRTTRPFFAIGDRVEAISGDIKGVRGIVVEIDHIDPWLVRVHFQGAARAALIHEDCIERISLLELLAQAASGVRRR